MSGLARPTGLNWPGRVLARLAELAELVLLGLTGLARLAGLTRFAFLNGWACGAADWAVWVEAGLAVLELAGPDGLGAGCWVLAELAELAELVGLGLTGLGQARLGAG